MAITSVRLSPALLSLLVLLPLPAAAQSTPPPAKEIVQKLGDSGLTVRFNVVEQAMADCAWAGVVVDWNPASYFGSVYLHRGGQWTRVSGFMGALPDYLTANPPDPRPVLFVLPSTDRVRRPWRLGTLLELLTERGHTPLYVVGRELVGDLPIAHAEGPALQGAE